MVVIYLVRYVLCSSPNYEQMSLCVNGLMTFVRQEVFPKVRLSVEEQVILSRENNLTFCFIGYHYTHGFYPAISGVTLREQVNGRILRNSIVTEYGVSVAREVCSLDVDLRCGCLFKLLQIRFLTCVFHL